jgi:agmatine deiminase
MKNSIGFSSLLRRQFPDFAFEFYALLNANGIHYFEIEGTADIWVRDFMPIKNVNNEYILFKYWPSYLRHPKHSHLITNQLKVCEQLNLEMTTSDLILDGGNLVTFANKYLLTDRIFKDNHQLSQVQVLDQLEKSLQTDQLIIFPAAPHDFTGHIDGMMRFINEDLILVNEFTEEQAYFTKLVKVLEANHLKFETLSYQPYQNATYQSAKGIYINYLETTNHIIMPQFNLSSDQQTLEKIAALFPSKKILTINCNDLAKHGGLLNCISWN